MKNLTGIILAAGEGTRMKSDIPKVLHMVSGKPMLQYMLDVFSQLKIKNTIVVVGHKADQVKRSVKGSGLKFIRQKQLLGSGDAVRVAKDALSGSRGDVLIVCGDTPLVSHQSLRDLLSAHRDNQAACTMLTAITKNPTGYGRILRNEENQIVGIVEEQDADTYEKAINEINVGAYCFKIKELFTSLKEVKPENIKKEYYLTDVIKILNKKKTKIQNVYAQDEEEAFGVNSRLTLSHANKIINKRKIEQFNSGDVTIIDPVTTYIQGDVEIGRDTIIYPHTIIEGKIKIGKDCRIGPFARLRSGTILENSVQIGNFVELVRTKVKSGSKIKHHSYIGDAVIGKNVNVGAGVITANYDGKKKNITFIDDNAFIGVGTILIAPVKIGKRAMTGAGSVLTKDKNVPAGKIVVGVPARILKKRKK